MISVLVADDQTLVRSGFRLMLEQVDDFWVCAEVADGRAAVQAARDLDPDVVLMDIRMPVLDGIRATEQIVALAPRSRVLVLTTFDVDDYVVEALRVGAGGYLLKDVEPDALVAGIRRVAAGDLPLAPSVLRRVVEAYVGRGPAGGDERIATLSPREREVLALLGEGRTNAEICAALVVSMPTTKTHVASILAKLDLRDRVQAAILAHTSGLIR